MRIASLVRVLAAVTVSVVSLAVTAGAQEKALHTQKTVDAVITLKSETWKQGPNKFVLEFSTLSGQPLDAGKVTLSTSMTMPGMGPMIAGATLAPDKAPGRYVGTISFFDSGTRQVTVNWDGPGGKGSTRFPVPVR